jgi:flagellar basal-body rod modification protein FlgD
MDSSLQTQNGSNIQMDYMKLLVTQLQNQNPLEPMDNNDMSAQLTQFSQLEQLEAMSKNFASVLTSMERSYSGSLLGKNVNFTADDGYGGTVEKTAVVDEIIMDHATGETKLKVVEGTGTEHTELHNDPYTGETYIKLVQSDPVEHVIGLDDVTVLDGQQASTIDMSSSRQFAGSLVGHQVTFYSTVNPATGEIAELTGHVDGFSTDPYAGTNILDVDVNGTRYPVDLKSVRAVKN